MNDIRICFGRWDDFKSKVIRWITKSDWSHVWIEYYSSTWDHTMVVHADAKGVMIEPIEGFIARRKNPSAIVKYKILKGDIQRGFSLSREYLGKDYGYTTLFKNASLLLLQRIGVKNLKGAKDIGKYTCSEFVTLFLQHAGVYPMNKEAEFIWPGLLEQQLSNNQFIESSDI